MLFLVHNILGAGNETSIFEEVEKWVTGGTLRGEIRVEKVATAHSAFQKKDTLRGPPSTPQWDLESP